MHQRTPSSAVAAASTGRLLQMALMVLVFHVGNSILQEAVFHLPGFRFTILMGVLQTACVTCFAYLDFKRQGSVRRAPWAVYICLSVFSTASTILTNEASHRVNYPTQVIFKSSKLLFVMALRAFALRRHKTSTHEIVSALSIVAGLIAFTWATSSTKALSSTTTGSDRDFLLGVVAILVAVTCDALLYVGEEKFCFQQHSSTSTEVILFTNMIAVAYGSMTLVTTGQAAASITWALSHPAFLVLIVAFSLCNFCGTTFLLHIVNEFGSSTAVVVTSTRKMATVLCSYVIYPKPFTGLHAVGLFGVAYGIWLHDQARKKEPPKKPSEDSDSAASNQRSAPV